MARTINRLSDRTVKAVSLERFDGPDVLSWQVLREQPSSHYRPGEWNTIKVRVDPVKITAWVNGHEVLSSTDVQLRGGKVGLAKFRQTQAEFKQFRLAEQLTDDVISATMASSASAAAARGLKCVCAIRRTESRIICSSSDNSSGFIVLSSFVVGFGLPGLQMGFVQKLLR